VTTFSPYPANPGSAPEYQSGPPPVLVAVAGPAPQRRLTVLIRLILLVPHFIVLYILMLAVGVVVTLGWWGALFMGRLPLWAGSFLAGMLRWSARVIAYGLLLTDAYPPFTFDDDPTYPVRLALPEPQRLNRAAVFFRVILIIPANIVCSVVVFGSGTLMGFIAWLITLVTGRLPESFHGAFTAVVRYEVRFYAYWWMLTPTYPGGLFGDKPGIPAWADQPAAPAVPAMPAADGLDLPDTAGLGITPPFGATPGFGTAESVYGTTPEGYGAPYSPYAAPGAVPAPGGYGYPTAPGYGAPAAYGSRSLFQPATWTLLLTSGAKKLVATFIVLGTVLWLFYVGLISLSVSTAGSESNAVIAANAIAALNTSYATLNNKKLPSAIQACGNNLSCVDREDAKAATAFSDFASQLQDVLLPASAASAGARLDADALTVAQNFKVLSQSTTASQYDSALTSTRLVQNINEFDTDYSALGQKLSSF
jgi:Domain of unknown function (DUF4389)